VAYSDFHHFPIFPWFFSTQIAAMLNDNVQSGNKNQEYFIGLITNENWVYRSQFFIFFGFCLVSKILINLTMLPSIL